MRHNWNAWKPRGTNAGNFNRTQLHRDKEEQLITKARKDGNTKKIGNFILLNVYFVRLNFSVFVVKN